jgi:hypothetical protein
MDGVASLVRLVLLGRMDPTPCVLTPLWSTTLGKSLTPLKPRASELTIFRTSGATVNAAYFGKETMNQLSPTGNGTTSPKTTAAFSSGTDAQLAVPGSLALVSALVGSSYLALSLL